MPRIKFILLLILLISPNVAPFFKKRPPVLWRVSDIKMLKDEKNVEHVVVLRDQTASCDALVSERFRNTSVDPVVQGRLSYLCRSAIREATLDKIAEAGICEELNESQAPKREKRFIFALLIGFAVASFITYSIGLDIIEAVAVRTVNSELQSIKKQNILLSQNAMLLAKALGSVEEQVKQLQSVVAAMPAEIHKVQDFKMDILQSVTQQKIKIDHVISDWKDKKVDKAFRNAFPSNLPEQHHKGGSRIKCSINRNESSITFLYRMKFADSSKTIFEASTFELRLMRESNGMNETCLVHYTGPKYAVEDGNCTYPSYVNEKDITDSSFIRDQTQACLDVKSLHSDKLWSTHVCNKGIHRMAEVKYTKLESFVYCPGMKITMLKTNQTWNCPMFPFSFGFAEEFEVGGYAHTLADIRVTTFENISDIMTYKLNYQFYSQLSQDFFLKADGLEEAIAAVNTTDRLLKSEQENAKVRGIVTHPGWDVVSFLFKGFGSYFLSPVTLIVVFAALLGGFKFVWTCIVSRDKQRKVKMRRNGGRQAARYQFDSTMF